MLIFKDNQVRTDPGDRWGEYHPINPVAGDPPPQAAPGAKLIIYSGTPADNLFDAHPLSWGERAQLAFMSWCEQACKHGAELMVRTHARHVLCDATRCISFAEWVAEKKLPIGILLDPGALIEATMKDDLDDHIERMFRLAGRTLAGVMLGTGEPSTDLSFADLARAVAASSREWGFQGELIVAEDHVEAVTKAFAGIAQST